MDSNVDPDLDQNPCPLKDEDFFRPLKDSEQSVGLDQDQNQYQVYVQQFADDQGSLGPIADKIKIIRITDLFCVNDLTVSEAVVE